MLWRVLSWHQNNEKENFLRLPLASWLLVYLSSQHSVCLCDAFDITEFSSFLRANKLFQGFPSRNRRTKNKERTFQLNPTCLYVTLMSQPLTVIIFLCVQASWCLHSVHCPRNARGLFVCVCMWNFLTTSRIRIK